MRDNANQPINRYGNTRVSRILKRCNDMRKALRDGEIEAIQDAWDALEPFLPYFMQKQGKEMTELTPEQKMQAKIAIERMRAFIVELTEQGIPAAAINCAIDEIHHVRNNETDSQD